MCFTQESSVLTTMRSSIPLTMLLVLLLTHHTTGTPVIHSTTRKFRRRSSRTRSMRKYARTASSIVSEVERNTSCFPARARVSMRDRDVPLSMLRVGNKVRTRTNSFSRVFMFTHAEDVGMFEFVALHTTSGNLTASEGHIVHTARGAIPAGHVRVKDNLLTADGTFAAVTCKTLVREHGLYNPQTLDGNLIIDGFIVSTFTTAVPAPAAASLLVLLRALFRITRLDWSLGCLEKNSFARSVMVLLAELAFRKH